MGYGIAIEEAGEVDLYRFGRSRQIFRGPKPNLKNPYIAFIGGSEPFGKFVTTPFPKLVQRKVKKTCVNWGTPGAGPGFFLKDPMILGACSDAEICVVQAMDAVPLSNRMYSVFPRRNFRLRAVSDMLKALYPKIDFENFKYVPAMIRKIQSVDATAYKIVLAEQRSAWMARMLELLEDIETNKALLWLAPEKGYGDDCIITEEMVNVVAKKVDRVIKVEIPNKRTKDMLFGSSKKDSFWMTRSAHETVAKAVSDEVHLMLSSGEKISA
ncbi:MAG: DUF6473 family protein [Paracoccaceae bacterium]